MSDFHREGLKFLREAQEGGGINAATLVELLEMRRELLTATWSLPIWRELGEGYIGSEKKHLRQLRPIIVEKGYSLKRQGIFLPFVKQDLCVRWGGLLRPPVDGHGKVVGEATWCLFTYAARKLGINDQVSASEVVKLYGRAADVLRWLADAVEQAGEAADEKAARVREVKDVFHCQAAVFTGPILAAEFRERYPDISFPG